MRKHLKKYFIPHIGNDHQPHILREKATLFFLLLIVAAEAVFLLDIFLVFPHSSFLAEILPAVLVDEANHSRLAGNITPLKVNPTLEKGALLKASDMALRGYFSHTTPDGKTPWYFFGEAGYSFAAAGENLAVNFFDSKAVADAWMNSPGHRANILNANFTEIGIATARGNYQGREAVFVVQFFGTPARPAPLPARLAIIPQAEARAPVVSSGNVKAAMTPPPAQETFVAVKNETAEAIPSSAPEAKEPSIVNRLVSRPGSAMNFLFVSIAGLIFVALLLKIFVKIRIQYPLLIANGALVLVVIAAALVINDYLNFVSTQII